ncbi:sensor histidine kinase [Bradyrhizobium sp. JR3.5]
MDVRHFTEPIHFTQPVAFAGRRTLSRACFCVQKPCIRIGNEVAAECDHIHLSFSDYPWAIGQERMIGLDGPDHPVWVSGKTDAIEDALRNLIDNAVVYSLPRSEVTVTVLTKGAVPIADYGPAIPEQDRSRIFERFWRGRAAQGRGAGLGFTIVAQVAAAHGGSIERADAPGGAAFTLRLRLAEPHATPLNCIAATY